ncbi:hypothetical protein J0X14_10230 [Muricauda sp. CAU 1633]|uniref:hypothetical protein n=1 Tax=Allomuricauda sp. CAU 1633 TaxID=2816036 RepID=UPI001A8FE3B9|nr:hypothetical protein [Muricauda sp. CAU 1633]MBO0322674.1 hypothetical protein [Muricauda sp. CAU 1633]
MKTKLIRALAVMLLCLPLTVMSQELRGKIKKSIEKQIETFPEISENKTMVLNQLASRMASNMDKENYTVAFIDQANSEISQLAMIWLTTGLIYYNLNESFSIESAGVKGSEQPINLSELETHGFKVKNEKDIRINTINVKYGSGFWEVERKNIDSLNLDDDNSIKVYVEDGLTNQNAEVLFENREAIAREMLYVAAQVNAIVKAKMSNLLN